MTEFSYQCEASSIDGFLSQLCRYISSGHYFYLASVIPNGKEPREVDRKLITLYGIDLPRWKRARRHLGGNSGVHYLRFRRFIVLLATHGQHRFFEDHGGTFRDIRRNALQFDGYSIRLTHSKEAKRVKVFIRLTRDRYLDLRSHLLDCAVRPSFREASHLESLVAGLQLVWYRPVREQVHRVIAEVNRRRRHRGFEPIAIGCIPKFRRLGTVFVQADAA
ncbi:MAG: hypothetical protein R3E01_32935 [Pirellulaceae bacterium]